MLSSTLYVLLIVLVLLASIFILGVSQQAQGDLESMSLYDFSARDIHGREVSLQEYASAKAILIGNERTCYLYDRNCITCNIMKAFVKSVLMSDACICVIV